MNFRNITELKQAASILKKLDKVLPQLEKMQIALNKLDHGLSVEIDHDKKIRFCVEDHTFGEEYRFGKLAHVERYVKKLISWNKYKAGLNYD